VLYDCDYTDIMIKVLVTCTSRKHVENNASRPQCTVSKDRKMLFALLACYIARKIKDSIVTYILSVILVGQIAVQSGTHLGILRALSRPLFT
jgi:hypothetical protein